MEIVRLQKEHCEILAELEKLCFSHPWSQRAIEDEVHNPNAYFVTAVDGDKILGYGGMHCTHQECYVDNIAVFGHHRGLELLAQVAGAVGAENHVSVVHLATSSLFSRGEFPKDFL